MRLLPLFSKPRNDENSRIPYRDPPKGLGDDREFQNSLKINLEFPKNESRISRDCFASLAMTEF